MGDERFRIARGPAFGIIAIGEGGIDIGDDPDEQPQEARARRIAGGGGEPCAGMCFREVERDRGAFGHHLPVRQHEHRDLPPSGLSARMRFRLGPGASNPSTATKSKGVDAATSMISARVEPQPGRP